MLLLLVYACLVDVTYTHLHLDICIYTCLYIYIYIYMSQACLLNWAMPSFGNGSFLGRHTFRTWNLCCCRRRCSTAIHRQTDSWADVVCFQRLWLMSTNCCVLRGDAVRIIGQAHMQLTLISPSSVAFEVQFVRPVLVYVGWRSMDWAPSQK